ncbi:IS200/IS605 family accessory protein TnpB-related protein [Bacillus sp. 1NLA3E]|uniref:IS200/IS605 family accessory protein TnpB-related protein n=1 Tax=Bacillus sp. 1NLA3E TaxID=666686 RepID=UPI000247E41D|nr:IS200/IS605 family accessory protein TnpB-related protein [Bacillus sp. 1NLA3E]AGK52280.1 transposase, IS605 OrfB family protein [Bacillus sp. 1NLA3E]
MTMSIKTYFSNRIYKHRLSEEFVTMIEHALFLFNQAKHTAFNTLVKEKRSGKSKRTRSLHLTVKEQFKLDDYYANSVVQEAKAVQSSLIELNKLYIKNKAEQINSIKKKLKKVKSHLTTLQKIKKSFVKGKPSFPKNAKEQKEGNFFVVHYKMKTDLYYHAYEFEHQYLDVQMKKLKSKIGFLICKLNRKEDEVKQLKTKISSVTFGSKKRFKSQFTVDRYANNHEIWKNEWEKSRYHQMKISGRKDSHSGNFVFHYDLDCQRLRFKTPSGVVVFVENLHFPYGQDKIETAILTQKNCKNKKKFGKPIAWSVEDHGDFYIFKCMINEEENPSINYSKLAGIIGVDCNVNHFAISNANSKGQLLSSWSLPFDIKGKSSNQVTKILEAEAIEVVNIAYQANKPIAVEDLDTTLSKVSHPYGNKKANQVMSMFAYSKMIASIKARAEKMNVAVFEVNPAYTSQIGKMKYMKRFGISIHEAASFVIARRAMGFKEKLPPTLGALLPEKIIGAHHWRQWGYVSKCLKGIRTCAFYQSELFDGDKFRLTNELFSSGALTDLEKKGLSIF